MATNTRKVERWGLDRLQPHPKQTTYFPDAPIGEVEELAADLARNGQLLPIEILPDGVILCGHRRVKAARMLGWAEVDAYVRHDLADDPAAAEMRVITDNVVRRQLGPLELAGLFRRLKELAQHNPGGPLLDSERGDLRDKIGKRLGIAGRTLDRYLRVLDAPQEVRAAVAAGKLGVNAAEQVAGLTAQQQAEIAAELRAGGEPKAVARRFLAAAPPRTKNAIDAKDRLVKALKRAAADLDGRLREVHFFTGRDMQALRDGQGLLGRLLEQGRAVRAAEGAEDGLSATEEVDLEADEAEGGPADASGPDKLSGGSGRRPGLGANGKISEYSAASGDGPDLPGDRPAPGQAAGRRAARKPGQSRPAGAKEGRARP